MYHRVCKAGHDDKSTGYRFRKAGMDDFLKTELTTLQCKQVRVFGIQMRAS